MGNLIGVLFDGVAYGSLLFLISVGLSVTMGLMNFINLAHGAFAMLGGFVCVTLLSRLGVPFLLTLPLAFLASAAAGFVLERLLYRRLYKAPHLDQVLFSIGLTFMAVAGATYIFGPSQQPVELPAWLRGQVGIAGLDVGRYRLFLIGVVVLVTLALGYLIERTRFGAQIRASVDNQVASAGLGINVSRVFSLTFALGLGPGRPRRRPRHRRARPGPDLPDQVHGVLPAGRRGRRRGHHQGPAAGGHRAGHLRRRRQVLRARGRRFRHLRADGGPAAAVPQRPAREAHMTPPEIVRHGLADGRWKPLEILFWLLPVAAYFLAPGYLVLVSQIMIVGLFALSLDLILGYAGIVSLGHAAFFGLGAYTAGLLAAHGWGEPISGLFAAAAVAALAGYLVSFLIVRGQDLTRLMVTLGIGLMLFEAANKAAFITGGVDGLSGMMVGKLLGVFEFDLYGKTAYIYSLVVLFILFVALRRLVNSPFGLSLQRHPRRRPAHAGDRRATSAAACRPSSPSAPRSPAWPVRCWRRRRSSSASTRWASRVRPSC